MVKTTVILSGPLWTAAKNEGTRRRISLSQVVSEVLENHFGPQSKGGSSGREEESTTDSIESG